VTYFTYRYTHS